MKVHITATPEISIEEIKIIASILKEVPGDILYFESEPLTYEQLEFIDAKFQNYSEIELLTFDDLFNIIGKSRIMKAIKREDFLVLLTTKTNSKYWFSGTSNRNIFVDTKGWEYITGNDSKYGISYQIIENIFQSLIGIDYNNALTDPNVHHLSTGCINDMCQRKLEIIAKLRNAYICVSCQHRANEMNVSNILLSQILTTIEKIRTGLINYNLILNAPEPKPTLVSERGVIKIGDTEINLPKIPKTLFTFYLANLDGVRADSLKESHYKDKLIAIYHFYRKGGKKESIDKLCLPYDNEGSTFPKVRWEVNKYLILTLDRILSEFYVINSYPSGKHNIYKIKLPKEYLSFKLPL